MWFKHHLYPALTMLGLGSQTKPCLRMVAIIACVTLVSIFYLLRFGQPVQLIRPPLMPVFRNEGGKHDTSILCKRQHSVIIISEPLTQYLFLTKQMWSKWNLHGVVEWNKNTKRIKYSSTTPEQDSKVICPWSETLWKWRPDVLLVVVPKSRNQARVTSGRTEDRHQGQRGSR